MSDAGHVVIMAGGTGGHVFPALAVADALRSRGVQVSWLGTRRGLEARLVPAAGISIDWLDIRGLRGNGLRGWLVAPWRVSRAVAQAMVALRRRRADAVLGMGGFAAGPGGVAGWLLRRPLVIHEQNSIAGLTNRLLARFATRVLQGFPNTFNGLKAPASYCGNPVRSDIAALPHPNERFSGRNGPLRLLVLGGSQGAKAINEVVIALFGQVDRSQRPQLWHQTGQRHLEACRAGYHRVGLRPDDRVEPFIDDMPAAYAWADLVLCRAGALTIAELAAAGVGSILVPYPYAVDDHQTHNAALLTDAGAATLVQEADLTPQWLARQLLDKADRSGLLTLATNARAQAKPDAAEQVAMVLLETIAERRKHLASPDGVHQ